MNAYSYTDSRLLGCDKTQPFKSQEKLWECVQPLCDGVHHYMQVSPWRWR